MNGMFDPDPEELDREREQKRFNSADYSFVSIPGEVRNAFRSIAAAELTLNRLSRYPRMNYGMRTDYQTALHLKSSSESIVRRFFATCQVDNRTGIPEQ